MRAPLLISMALQVTIALTFGVALMSLSRGFQRRAALRFGVAWLTYAAGVLLSAAGYWRLLGPIDGPASVLVLPLQWGVVLFRAGIDALVDPDRSPGRGRYAVDCGVLTVIWVLGHALAPLAWPEIPGVQLGFVFPRLLLGFGFAWSAWPLWRLRAQPARTRLLTAALTLLSLRMFVAAAYDIWQIRAGVPAPSESVLLSVLQVCLLIVFGLATTQLLTESEAAQALRAARTIRDTAEALNIAQARLRFVAEHSSDVQLLLSRDRRIRYAAPSSERHLGHAPAALEGRDFVELVHEEDRAKALWAFETASGAPALGWPLTTLRLRKGGGDWLEADVSGQLLRDAPDDAAIALSVRDMTEHRRLYAALMNRQRLESLGGMAAGIAHDFNNTLMGVTACVDAIVVERGANAHPLLAEISAAAVRGSALVNQLLTFARQQQVEPERFDAGARVRRLEALLVRSIGPRAAIRIEADPSGLHAVCADPNQFDQVIVNLALNARDAMPDGGQVTIRVSSTDRGRADGCAGCFVRVEVIDTGIGIPLERMPRIFEPFFTTKAAGTGTGLGLPMAYGFARQAGGDLSVESQEGRGARFTLELPAAGS